MECLFLTGQRLFISVSVCVAGQPQTLVPMACLYLVSINVHRPRWPCSVSVSAHPRPQLRSSLGYSWSPGDLAFKTGIFHEVTRFDRVLTQRLTAEVCLANQPFIQSAIHSSFSPSLHLTVCLSFHLATLPFFHTSTLAPIHPSIHPLICAFVHLSVCLFIQQGFMEPWLCQVRC